MQFKLTAVDGFFFFFFFVIELKGCAFSEYNYSFVVDQRNSFRWITVLLALAECNQSCRVISQYETGSFVTSRLYQVVTRI